MVYRQNFAPVPIVESQQNGTKKQIINPLFYNALSSIVTKVSISWKRNYSERLNQKLEIQEPRLKPKLLHFELVL